MRLFPMITSPPHVFFKMMLNMQTAGLHLITSLDVSPSGPCYSAETNRRLFQPVCGAHSTIRQPFCYSLWRGLCMSFLFCLSFASAAPTDSHIFSSFLQKLANISLRIQQIETTLSILEAKVGSWVLLFAGLDSTLLSPFVLILLQILSCCE